MSTFRGIVTEFPQIRIDYFRPVPDHRPPLACFLSHVHSDHLQGLESLKSPFIYCSPATREILLRLERYPHRMNFSKGVLESKVQTYKHLKNLLKIIPLETPTIVELSPGNELRVTLFDANHCVGAVMFLIEGDGKAILYTGDIRSESWWTNSLIQNPVLLPYTLGPLQLDCIYLDTTFARKSEHLKEFASKADGTRELLEKVGKYPPETIFYVESWTFGYEYVWLTLSSFLRTRVHLDRYRWGLYKSLRISSEAPVAHEASSLCGFNFGNRFAPGCLTSDSQVRLHSCERGSGCPVVSGNKDVVRIIPIVTRLKNGTEVAELGVGGGKGDLDQVHELETSDIETIKQLMELCTRNLKDRAVLSKVLELLVSAMNTIKSDHPSQGLRLDSLADPRALDGLPLEELVPMLGKIALNRKKVGPSSCIEQGHVKDIAPTSKLPSIITFPYSRHSSYNELCALVAAFRPKDIYPCTVDPDTWTPAIGMRALFGHLCSADLFTHDQEMLAIMDQRRMSHKRTRSEESSQRTDTTHQDADDETQSPWDMANEPHNLVGDTSPGLDKTGDSLLREPTTPDHHPSAAIRIDNESTRPSVIPGATNSSSPSVSPSQIEPSAFYIRTATHLEDPINSGSTSSPSWPHQIHAVPSPRPEPTQRTPIAEDSVQAVQPTISRQLAYKAALNDGLSWYEFGGLASAGNNHSVPEREL